MRLSRRTTFSLIAPIVVVAFVVVVIWRINSSRRPVDTATVYAGYLAAAAIAVTLLLAVGAPRCMLVGWATLRLLSCAPSGPVPPQLIWSTGRLASAASLGAGRC